jgi:hypothetical protein
MKRDSSQQQSPPRLSPYHEVVCCLCMPVPAPPSVYRRGYICLLRWSIKLRYIRREKFLMLEAIFSWSVLSIIICLLIGAGFGVLSMTPPRHRIAEVCFCIAAIIFFTKFLYWAVTSNAGIRERLVVSLATFGVTGMLLVWSLIWIEAMLPKSVAISAAETARTTQDEGGARRPESKTSSTFKEIPGGFVVIIGGTEHAVSRSSTKQHPSNIAPFADARAIQAYIENDKVYVDAVLYYSPGQSLQLAHNELRDRPPKWDVNFDDSAIEIVDEKLIPRFQLIYKDARTVILRGVFQFPSGSVVFEDHARFFIGSTEDTVNIARLFKYPSRLHKGEELDTNP